MGQPHRETSRRAGKEDGGPAPGAAGARSPSGRGAARLGAGPGKHGGLRGRGGGARDRRSAAPGGAPGAPGGCEGKWSSPGRKM